MPWFYAAAIGRDGTLTKTEGPDSLPVFVPYDPDAERFLRRRQHRLTLVVEVGHSEPEHHLGMAWLNYCWKTKFREEYPDADAFRAWVSACVGHYRIRYIDVPDGNGGTVKMQFNEIKSWSFAKSHWDEFHDLMGRCEALLTAHGCPTWEDFKRNRHIAMEET